MEKTNVFYDLKDFAHCADDFMYVYPPTCTLFGKYRQTEDGVCNYLNADVLPKETGAKAAGDAAKKSVYLNTDPEGYAYISVQTKKQYDTGTDIVLHCAFQGTGAPLICFTDDLAEKNGEKVYGLYYEVVAYAQGCNIWRVNPPKQENAPFETTLLGNMCFPVEGGTVAELKVEFGDGGIQVQMNGHCAEVKISDIPKRFHIGFTACEGICQFSDFAISSPKQQA